MNRKKTILVFLMVFFVFCGIGYAQPRNDDNRRNYRGQACEQDVRQDIEKAQSMVRHGISTGQIDSREADRIRQNIRRVESDLNRFVSDGRLNPKECERMQRETRSLYSHIRQEMTDNDNRRNYRGQACERDVRQDIEKAHSMVRHGISTGQIDSREAEGIRQNIRRVESDLNRFVSDGRLNPKECERMQRETRNLYRHIRQDMTDNDGRRDYRGQACEQEVRQDMAAAQMVARDGIDSGQINSQETFVLKNKFEELERDLNRSVADGRLHPKECARLKQKVNDLRALIQHAMNN